MEGNNTFNREFRSLAPCGYILPCWPQVGEFWLVTLTGRFLLLFWFNDPLRENSDYSLFSDLMIPRGHNAGRWLYSDLMTRCRQIWLFIIFWVNDPLWAWLMNIFWVFDPLWAGCNLETPWPLTVHGLLLVSPYAGTEMWRIHILWNVGQSSFSDDRL